MSFATLLRRSQPICNNLFSRTIPYLFSTAHLQSIPPSRIHLLRTFCTQSNLAKPSAVQTASSQNLVLSSPALVVTREYEWANIIVGFEQANKYTIRAAPGGSVVGYLAEENSIGKTVLRNLMRTHRPFKATVFDKNQNIIFIMRRPMYLISTSIFIETEHGQLLGEVHMNWHLWRRRYQLFVDKQQFANVDSGFLAVDFDMRDVNGAKLASVNKDFTGFAREIFTDARQYVLRMDPHVGLQHDGDLIRDAATLDTGEEQCSDVKLGHKERAVILATAISIDFDYFSVHSRGTMYPGIMPIPGAGGGAAPVPPVGGGAGAAGSVAGAEAMSGAMEGGDIEDQYKVSMNDEESVQDLPPTNDDGQFDPASDANQSEWATFEQPDHGFDETFKDDSAWSEGNETWSDGVDGGEEGGGGIFGIIKGIFFDNDEGE